MRRQGLKGYFHGSLRVWVGSQLAPSLAGRGTLPAGCQPVTAPPRAVPLPLAGGLELARAARAGSPCLGKGSPLCGLAEPAPARAAMEPGRLLPDNNWLFAP